MYKIFFLTGMLLLMGSSDCEKFKKGTFVLDEGNGKAYIITRKKNKQIEEDRGNGVMVEFDLEWTSDCSYKLYNPNVVKGDIGPILIDTLYCEITDVKGDSYRAVCHSKGYPDAVTPPIVKID
ncbi:hypothetical protein FUA48_16505 [Flavobacterium alkalisoli]|uniref:Uncharacterized protein n=1 Tax=Flavobacterium alkalisoli TaxID=2602769 RepID=A0A5B9G214_9FLAO|nr:hypothetical protein [Flavobacterium alkalisoli]QEE51117.1 hypothetical protein FUA48_16505 [Flavobacterium alkalisoli]